MMTGLTIRPGTGTRYDVVSLGEVMLRLDPGEGRIRNSRSFTAWEGGGEYNVARGLRRCFGLRTAVVTALADNDVGWLIEDLILQGGVDTSLVQFETAARPPPAGMSRSNRYSVCPRPSTRYSPVTLPVPRLMRIA